MRALIVKHTIACFIFLTFLISLGIGFPLKLYLLNGAFQSSEIGLNYLSKILVTFGPALSAIIITYIITGNKGVIALFSKLKPHTIHIIWWVALPVIGVTVTAIAFVAGGFKAQELITFVTAASPLLLITHFISALVIIGIGEELGWRGFLLPKFAQGRTIFMATCMVAVIWAIWHAPLFFSGYHILIPFLIAVLSLSIIFTWLWDRVGGNVFVLAIAHASVDFPQAFFEARVGADHDNALQQSWAILSVIYLAIAISVFFLNRKRWQVVLTPGDERLLPGPEGMPLQSKQ